MADAETQAIYEELKRRGVFHQDAEAQQIGHELRRRGVVSDPTQGGTVAVHSGGPTGNGDPYGDPAVMPNAPHNRPTLSVPSPLSSYSDNNYTPAAPPPAPVYTPPAHQMEISARHTSSNPISAGIDWLQRKGGELYGEMSQDTGPNDPVGQVAQGLVRGPIDMVANAATAAGRAAPKTLSEALTQASQFATNPALNPVVQAAAGSLGSDLASPYQGLGLKQVSDAARAVAQGNTHQAVQILRNAPPEVLHYIKANRLQSLIAILPLLHMAGAPIAARVGARFTPAPEIPVAPEAMVTRPVIAKPTTLRLPPASPKGAVTAPDIAPTMPEPAATLPDMSTKPQNIDTSAGHADANDISPQLPKTPVPEIAPASIADNATAPAPPNTRLQGDFPVDQLHVDPERFQYKMGAGEHGQTGSLTGAQAWNPDLAGVAHVWRDPADGQVYVVNGHNRYALARRTGAPAMDVRFLDAPDAQAARTQGALINIAEGQGTAIDAAKLFRDQKTTPEQLQTQGINLKGQKATQGLALANLSPSLFGQVVRGEMPIERGALIGEKLPDPADQQTLTTLLDKAAARGKAPTNDTISEIADQIKNGPTQEETTSSLFGDDTATRSLAVERAEVAAHIKAQLGKDGAAFGAAARNADRLKKGNNVIDAETSGQIALQSRQGAELFDRFKNQAGPVSDILNRAAARLAKGDNANVVKSDAVREFQDTLPTLSQLPGTADATGLFEESGSASPGTRSGDPAAGLGTGGRTGTDGGEVYREPPELDTSPGMFASPDHLSRKKNEAPTSERGGASSLPDVPARVYRIDTADATLSADKPHGVYFSHGDDPANSPHADVGDTVYTATAHPENPLVIKGSQRVTHARFGRGGSGEASAGVAALKSLVSPEEMTRLLHASKPELIKELNEKFPGPDYGKYHDSYELLEAYGGQAARAAGHDAIVSHDPLLPEFSEYVGLKPRAYSLDKPRPNVPDNGAQGSPDHLGDVPVFDTKRALPRNQDASLSVGDLYDLAESKPRSQMIGAHAVISPEEAQRIKNDTNVDVAGYAHAVSTDGIIHILREHRDNPMPGESLVTRADIERIPEIVAHPDKVEYAGKTDDGLDTLKYYKQVNGHILYVEEVRTGKKLLVTKAMYKRKRGPAPDAVRKDSPGSDAQDEPGLTSNIPKNDAHGSIDHLDAPDNGIVLQSTILPGAEKFIEQDVVPSVQAAVRGVRQTAQEIRHLLSPASGVADAGQTARIIRENAADLAMKRERAKAALEGLRRTFDAMPEAGRLRFIDDLENGRPQANPQMQQAANLLRTTLDTRVAQIQALGTGKLQNFIADYFPHIWEDPKKAQAVFGQIFGKRPLEGSKSFLKKRTIPTTADGIAQGLKPVTTNPVELALLKSHEMDRYIMGQRVLQEMKAQKLAKFVGATERAPEGYVKIDDRIAQVMQPKPTIKADGSAGAPDLVLRGHYYAPEGAARVLNNYLSPGLRGKAWYQGLQYAGNVLNQAQLGLSAFHLGFTAMDSATSKFALGVEQISRWQIGRGTSNIVKAAVPLYAPIENMIRGNKVLKEYMRPGTQGGEMAQIVDALQAGGGRVRMDDFYRTSAAGNFWKALRQGNYPGALLRAVPAIIEKMAAPLMEEIVPRMKMGVFADMARAELERMPVGASRDQVREAMAKVWDSVDNRMGQVVYDNLFWHRTLKDLGLVSTRSLGWNLGTFRELGGGLADTAAIGKRLKAGEAAVTHRMAYVTALPVMVGLYGALYQYLATGQGPTELKDYFYPRTGRLRPDGHPERVQLPTYAKDVGPLIVAAHNEGMPGVATTATKMVTGKVHPLFGAIFSMLQNQDFYGTEIRNENDPLVKQVGDSLAFAGKQFLPFSLEATQKRKESGATVGQQAQSFFGLTPAPASVDQTRAQRMLYNLSMRHLPKGARTQADAEKSQRAMTLMTQARQGSNVRPALIQLIQNGQMTERSGENILSRAQESSDVNRLKHLTLDEAFQVWAVASPQERQQWHNALLSKLDNAANSGSLTLAQLSQARQSRILPPQR